MPSNRQLRIVFGLILSATILLSVMSMDLSAQTTTGTILGTVTDTTGAVVPDASVRITNTGTAASVTTASDSQGRYRAPALPIGEYSVQVEKMGFQSMTRTQVTLTVGGDAVVDFALPVGELSQNVTVSENAVQVETTSSTLSNLVDQVQIRELPLNGRNFEQLILLAPGVTTMQAIGLTATNGFGASYSISGGRTRGQAVLMDDNDITNYQARNAGSGVLGSSLGVDAIAEFEVLTNTYSAQYGGNGGVINSVTKSGTNNLHGSVYEFFRNSALDARNFFDTAKPLFQKNQFGGTLGGPIVKDKMFFFGNYEAVRVNTGTNTAFILPDTQAHSGFVPNAAGVYQCVNNVSIAYLAGGANNAACAATIPAAVRPFMNFFPDPSTYPFTVNSVGGIPNGVVTAQETAQSPGREDFIVGRYDWNVSSKDSVFARYLYDRGRLFEPFSSSTLSPAAPQAWGSNDSTKNQFVSIEEKHIFSNYVINSTRFGFSRTYLQAYAGHSDPLFQFSGPNLWDGLGFPVIPNGSISITPQLLNPNYNRPSLAGGVNFRNIQNKYSVGDDVFWNVGPHGFRFGAEVKWVQSYGVTAPSAGSWSFPNITALLTQSPTSYTGTCVATVFPTCASLATQPTQSHFYEKDFAFYIQDDWKATRTITLNLGLRYSPVTNPHADGLTSTAGLNLPLSSTYNPSLPMPGCSTPVATPLAPTTPTFCVVPAGTLAAVPIHNIYLKNPSLRNFDPRIGIAWDPFKDHKTSVRAGYGMFHSPVTPFDYALYFASPYISVTQSCAAFPGSCNSFPTPFQTATPLGTGTQSGSGIDPGNNRTAYVQQWNLTVQREIVKNTIVTVSYVGSHGVNLIGYVDENPPLPTGIPGAITVCSVGCNVKPGQILIPYTPVASQLVGTTVVGGFTGVTAGTPTSANGQAIVDPTTGKMSYSNVVCNSPALTGCQIVSNNRGDPALVQSVMRRSSFFSSYNALQVGIVRRMANNFQFQASYTYGECIDNSSGSQPLENGEYISNPYDPSSERSWCGYMVRNTFYTNGLYILPFKANRLVSGWQIGGIFQHHTGTPIWAVVGFQSGLISTGVNNNRPNRIEGCQERLATIATWINPACYTMQPIGETGNSPRSAVFGPDSSTLDGSVVKNTKISERFNVQFRAEFFNLLNRANFRNPAQPVVNLYSQASPLPASCATTPANCVFTAPLSQLTLTDTTSRQIQFGLKLIF